jgi:hypothetical protein
MKRTAALLAFVAPALAACGSSSEPAPSAFDEPVRVRFTPARSTANQSAQFFPGPLPSGTTGPVNSIALMNAIVTAGQYGKKVSGTAALTASGIALKFADVGTGYWVVPTLIADNTQGGLLWDVQLDLARSMPTGRHELQVAAIDESGNWGPASETPLFVQTIQPAGAAVATLTWDNGADLDIQILTPNGQIDPKHPSTGGFVDGGVPPGNGMLDRDSNASCVPDGLRQEDVVWADEPTPGLYLAKVDMFSACGEAATSFLFQLYVHDQLTISLPGRLLSIDADNGTGPGLALTNFSFP